MSRFLLFLLFFSLFSVANSSQAESKSWPAQILSLNIFDQQQGEWPSDFREKRLFALRKWLEKNPMDILLLQEASSGDGELFRKKYPWQNFVEESKGKDGLTYGYWLGAKRPVKEIWSDGFAFPGGVARKVQAAIWGEAPKKCLGILNLHWSYQSSAVRQEEAKWLLDWLHGAQKKCDRWLVVGDFNADQDAPEIQFLAKNGLVNLATKLEPTVGPANPIRQIYGKDIKAQTIDWAWGFHYPAKAKRVLADPIGELWLSDHAGIMIK